VTIPVPSFLTITNQLLPTDDELGSVIVPTPDDHTKSDDLLLEFRVAANELQ